MAFFIAREGENHRPYNGRKGTIISASFPNGTIFSVGNVLAAAKTVTAISNAAEGVASSTAHGYAVGDILLLSNSSRLDQRVVRIKTVPDANSFTLEGIDTTSTTLYPTGFGVGSAQKVTSFAALSQVTDTQSQGGEQQFYQWVYLEDGRQRQRPTFKNARSLQLTLDWDPTLAWHNALKTCDDTGSVYALRAALPTGAILLYSAYVSFDGEPSLTINENMKTSATFSLASPFSTRY